MQKGVLHLIPNLLSPDQTQAIPSYIADIVSSLKVFYVEEIKSARRFLKKMNKDIVIDHLTFFMLNEHENTSLAEATKFLNQGISIGYISEAGCPAVADPGQELVALAHQLGAEVKPHVGPNSILLALMASGFNGQQFRFLGYLPNKQPMLTQKIKEIEAESQSNNCTQIFIETPYRNHQLMEELMKHCNPNTKLCVAANLTANDEKIWTKTIREWKQTEMAIHKIPAVFVLYAY